MNILPGDHDTIGNGMHADVAGVGEQGADGFGQAFGVVLADADRHVDLAAVLHPQMDGAVTGLVADHHQLVAADVGDLQQLAVAHRHALERTRQAIHLCLADIQARTLGQRYGFTVGGRAAVGAIGGGRGERTSGDQRACRCIGCRCRAGIGGWRDHHRCGGR
ncbi:hypothetical protein D3C81_1422850 [compost metagenome]